MDLLGKGIAQGLEGEMLETFPLLLWPCELSLYEGAARGLSNCRMEGVAAVQSRALRVFCSRVEGIEVSLGM